jgi:hypothetical protein
MSAEKTVETGETVRLTITLHDFDSRLLSVVTDVLGAYNLDPFYDTASFDIVSAVVGATATFRTVPLSYEEGFELHGNEVEHFSTILTELEEAVVDEGLQVMSNNVVRLSENHATELLLTAGRTAAN